MGRYDVNALFPPTRRTRKFLGLKVTGGILLYLICLAIYLAVIAGFVFLLIWGGTKIVANTWEDETSSPLTCEPVGNTDTRFISLKCSGDDLSQPIKVSGVPTDESF